MHWQGYTIDFRNGQPNYASYVLAPYCFNEG